MTNVKGETVRYTYDAYGNKETMILPDGQEIRYTYDALNRMTGVTGTDGETTRYVYDTTGRRIKTESSTLTTAYEYDSVGNLLKQITEGDSNISFNYNHNRNGYITKEIRTENGEATESDYTYDALGQLTSFRQSTGYGEKYTYDVVGNMTQKVITPENKKTPVTLKMQYNKGNQLTEMSKGKDRITYSYDPNGSMVQKVLNSQKYGVLTDTYTYDVMDQLTGYTGYDGYAQAFTYDAGGMRLKKQEKGNVNRSTLEELLRGSIEGLPEIVEPGTVEEGYEWATTEYLYDITEGYYQVLQETTTKGSATDTASYVYGLERIAGYTADTKTSYIYDGRGSVAQTVTVTISGKIVDLQNDPTKGTTIQSYWYTPFGEQQHTKVTGFTYNAEAYDAATGMLNLRARQYEPAMNRFSQKDILKGQMTTPLSLNRYGYCVNSPILFADPSGLQMVAVAMDAGNGKTVDSKKTISNSSSVWNNINSAVAAAADKVKAVAKIASEKATETKKKKKIYDNAQRLEKEAWNATNLPREEQIIIEKAADALENLNISSDTDVIKAGKIVIEACTAIDRGRNASAVATPAPTLTPVVTAKPDQALPTRSENWNIGFRIADKTNEIRNQLYPPEPNWLDNTINIIGTVAEGVYNNTIKPHVDRFNRILSSSNYGELVRNVENFWLSGMVDDAEVLLYKGDGWDKLSAGINLFLKAFTYGGGTTVFTKNAYPTTADLWAIGNKVGAPIGIVPPGTFESAFSFTQDSYLHESIATLQESIFANQDFDSYEAFKRTYGAAGEGMEWHHIVEQNQANKSGFSEQQINSVKNIIGIEKDLHRQISGYYSHKWPFTENMILRDWLSGKDYDYQFQYGIQVLEELLKNYK